MVGFVSRYGRNQKIKASSLAMYVDRTLKPDYLSLLYMHACMHAHACTTIPVLLEVYIVTQ